MSQRDDKVYLEDIISSIEIIEQYVSDISEPEFRNNQMIQDAVTRRFEIIGEAATHISTDFKNSHSDIEWRLMGDMRNKLIHEYFGVNAITIYLTIKNDLPELKKKIANLL